MAGYIERDFKEAYIMMKERALDAEHERDALIAEISDAVKLLHDLLGLVPGSGEAAFAFVERHMLGVVSAPSGSGQ